MAAEQRVGAVPWLGVERLCIYCIELHRCIGAPRCKQLSSAPRFGANWIQPMHVIVTTSEPRSTSTYLPSYSQSLKEFASKLQSTNTIPNPHERPTRQRPPASPQASVPAYRLPWPHEPPPLASPSQRETASTLDHITSRFCLRAEPSAGLGRPVIRRLL